MSEVLITGGTGFLGTELVRQLVAGGNVSKIYCVTRNQNLIGKNNSDRLKYIGHRESLHILGSEPIRKIIHLATMYKRSNEKFSEKEMWETNVENPIQILAAASEKSLYFLNTNSYLQYDSTIYMNSNYYLKTKVYFQDYLESFTKSTQIKHGSIIVGDTYGIDDRRDKVLNQMIEQAWQGEFFQVNNPEGTIRLSHVSTIVNAIQRMSDHKLQKTISTVSNFQINLNSLAKFVFNVIHNKFESLDDYHLEITKSNWTSIYENFKDSEDPKSDIYKFLLLVAKHHKTIEKLNFRN